MNRSKDYCCVYKCNSTYKVTGVSFHRFPSDQSRKKTWIIKLRMGKPPSKHMRVCSLHFDDSSFFKPTGLKKRRKLKVYAFPNQNLPKSSVTTSPKQSPAKRILMRRERAIKRNVFSIQNGRNELEKSDYDFLPLLNEADETEEVVEVPRVCGDQSINYLHLLNEAIAKVESHTNDKTNVRLDEDPAYKLLTNTDILKKDQTTECNLYFETPTLIDLIKTDVVLKQVTGLANMALLNKMSEALDLQFHPIRRSKTSTKNKIIITLMILKLNVNFTFFSILFPSVSFSTISRIFHTTLQQLASNLQHYIPSLDMSIIKNNMPVHFAKFPNVKMVLDCTEFMTEKPSCLDCRIRNYSQYKHGHTAKAMIGVSPGGLITFVSNCYGGRCSDTQLFSQSNVINEFDKNEALMVDKGFRINEICASRDVKVIQPPFIKNKEPLSEEQSRLTRDIARARVHVERVNQRIKNFGYFKNTITMAMLSSIDLALTVVCAIVNLSSPILADENFF